METVHRDAFVLHSFATPELPIKRGIIVLDLTTGKLLWTKHDLTFVAASGESIFSVTESIAGNALIETQYRTGELLSEWKGEAGEKKTEEVSHRKISDEALAFPQPISDSEESFPEMARVLQQEGKGAAEVVEVLQHGASTLLFTTHERTPGDAEGPGRKGILLHVMDRTSGQLLLEERLASNVSAAAPDSFFVQDGMLYYVKDLKELVAVKL